MIEGSVGTAKVPLRISRDREDVMRTKRSKKSSLTDQAAELVEQVQPHVEAARERIVNDYLPAAQSMLADARDVARDVAHDARDAAQEVAANAEKSTRKRRRRAARKARAQAGRLAAATAAAAPVTAPLTTRVADAVEPKPRRKKRFILLLALAGAGAVAVKRLRGEASTVTSYPPQGAPTPRPAPVPDPGLSTTPPPAATSQTPVAPDPDAPADPVDDATVDGGPGTETADQGGAFLDEVLADADEAPHEVTTPDQPAEVEDASGPSRHSRKR